MKNHVEHAMPRHATPRHATPRHATPRHATAHLNPTPQPLPFNIPDLVKKVEDTKKAMGEAETTWKDLKGKADQALLDAYGELQPCLWGWPSSSLLGTDLEPISLDELESDPATFANYHGVEDDPEAVAILDGFIQRGWLCEFDSLDALKANVGGDPVLNKLACRPLSFRKVSSTMAISDSTHCTARS